MANYACPVDDITWGNSSYPELQPTSTTSLGGPRVVYHQTSPMLYPSSAGMPLVAAQQQQQLAAPARKWTFMQPETATVLLFLAVVGLTIFVFHLNSRIATLNHMLQYLIMHGMAKNAM